MICRQATNPEYESIRQDEIISDSWANRTTVINQSPTAKTSEQNSKLKPRTFLSFPLSIVLTSLIIDNLDTENRISPLFQFKFMYERNRKSW